jgi:LysM repeat protein
LLAAALACSRADAPIDYGAITPLAGANSNADGAAAPGISTATLVPASPPVPGVPTATLRPTQDVSSSPTPDAARPSPLDRTQVEQYTVLPGDTLNEIGRRFGVTAAQIADANGVGVADVLQVGQVLLIPLPEETARGPDLKLLPDSEFVYGPGAVTFNIAAFVESQRGYLSSYTEDIPGYYSFVVDDSSSSTLTGSEIVQLVAQRYSIHPRLLLAVLEYQSGWVTRRDPGDNTLVYPLRRVEATREGLYRQLNWAANELNRGYYGWRAGWLMSLGFADGSIKVISPGLNAGTAGVQHFFSKVLDASEWTRAVSPEGFARTYQAMFGNPFRYAYEPLAPPDLVQPPMSLPFESGKVWAFTGGPHGAWDSGSAWGALDFGPPGDLEGCAPTDEWVTASAPGLIVRSEYGAVVEDLDEDGDEGTGWALFYLHVEARDRVEAGTRVAIGDHIGHPSCEGGVAIARHLHLARKYNGEWVSADGPIPFVLDGWVSATLGKEYDGTLMHGDTTIEACDCRAETNEISRP